MRTKWVIAGLGLALLNACSGAPGGDELGLIEQPIEGNGAVTPVPAVVATGLDGPRGLIVEDDGTILVAEAGIGGDSPCVIAGDGQPRCFGATGALTEISEGVARRVVTGLPSLATTNHAVAIGPHHLVRDRGRIHLVTGLALDPAARSDPQRLGGVAPNLASLLEIKPRPHGEWSVSTVADLGAFESSYDPDRADGGHVESNPFSLLPNRHGWYVLDAAGNDLLDVKKDGSISLVMTFPPRQVGNPPARLEPVPSALAEGPDGALYVGELTGFPFPVGEARVYRVRPGQSPTVFATGFTNIIDMAFDNAGNLLVLEIATNGLASGNLDGALWRVRRDGSQHKIVSQGLTAPTGVAVSNCGDVYISNCSICGPGAGSVLKFSGLVRRSR